jgi:PAS domain S-box-containing protein
MRSFRDIPIRHKLMVITMLTTTAALLLSGVGVVLSDSFLLRSYLQRDLASLARIIADNSTAALAFADPHAAAEMLTTLRARPHIESACIYRASGSILATYFRPGAAHQCPPPQPYDDLRFTSSDLTLSRPVVLNDQRIGTLVLLYDLDEVYERMLLYGGTVFGVLLASSLIALLLSSRLRAVIATPISQLVRATTSVSETRNYSVRAEKLSGDELGRLVDAFNEMLAGIQARDSELRQALIAREEALRQAQSARDSLKTTLESIADAVISTDVEGRVVFANRVAHALMKRPDTDFTGKALDEVFHIVDESTREKMENPVAKVLREGRITNVSNHTVLIANDGTEIPIDESGAPIRGTDGPIQGTVLVFRDVTVRRRADETSRLLSSIVEFSSDAIIGKDLNGIVTSWNQGAERIFGYTAQEMIGRSISTLAPPDLVHEPAEILERIKRGERLDNYQTVRQSRSGNLIHVSLSCSPLYDALGRITGASKIARDITQQVLAARRLEQLNADLQMSNERLGRSNEDLERFAFVASHDLQEPLRMITAYSQLLVERYDGPRDEEASMFVDNIVGGTTRMRELLADLLSYAEIGAGPEKPVTTVDLNGVIRIVTQNLKVAIDDSGAQIRADRLPSLRVYEGHFVSLFQNLIENAIKYRSDCSPDIRVSFQQTAEHMRFTISDNGIGIAPEFHDKIFSPFKRLHGKQIPGTGIGLALCRRVLERYAGRIWVESEVGKGTKFIFTLPRHEDFDVEPY